MDSDLRRVPIQHLIRELAFRAPRTVRDRLRRRRRTSQRSLVSSLDRTPFASLDLPGQPTIDLLSGYRNTIKGRWPKFFWPVRVLLDLSDRESLPRQLRSLAQEVSQARTLPVPVEEIVDLLKPMTSKYPQHVKHSELVEPSVRAPVFAMIPTEREVSNICRSYLSTASGILSRLVANGFKPADSRVLEIGCSRGYATYALSALGVGEAIGLDTNLHTYYAIAEIPRVRDAFLSMNDGRRSTTQIQEGDAVATPFDDESFDLVFSVSVLEHIPEPDKVFREMNRVLKSGGFAYHGVDPWFSPAGGHSMCTLDFPWGHLRLSAEQFEDYVPRYRPHERECALDFYHNHFQAPRLTVDQMESLVLEHGFEIKEWRESSSTYQDHYAILDSTILDECRRNFPAVDVRDMITGGYTILLRKR